MKRVGFIYEKIYDKSNIALAIKSASKDKKNKKMVKRINSNLEYYINNIYDMLKNKSYTHSLYKVSKIREKATKKERIIHKPKFYPDQIIHWCLMLQIEPLLERGLYKWSCGSIKGRGTHYAKRCCEKWLRNDIKNTKYCLKLDITKYYHSVNQEMLKAKFRKIIKDNDALWLIDTIVESIDKGLPIGTYTSQWFANFYFQEIDHYIKEELKVPYYVRYMDDLVLFSGNKRKLWKTFNKLIVKTKEHKLEIKGNYQLFEIDKRSLSFVGFVLNHQKTSIRKRITVRCRRCVIRFKAKPKLKIARAIVSYFGWYKHSNSYVLIKKYFKKYNVLLKAKEIIRNESRKINESFTRYAT